MDRQYRKANGVYLMRFAGSEYVYIGSTSKGFNKRRCQHLYRMKIGTHTNRHLQHAFNYHGADAFEFIVIEVVTDPSQIVSREQYWMDVYRNTHQLYNILPEAGTTKGRLGRPLTDTEKETIRAKLTGRKATEEQKQKQRDGWTPEARAKVSAAHRGRKASAATREKQRLRMTGNTINPKKTQRIVDASKLRPKQIFCFVAPDGTRYDGIPNISAFCREHGLSKDAMSQVHRGESRHHRGWTSGLRNPGYSFISPDGTRYDRIFSLVAFCQEHGLGRPGMARVFAGKQRHHKGWISGIHHPGYSFLSPNGTRYDGILNLAAFCREHGLEKTNMGLVNKGKRSHCHGWTKAD